ncbi:MAG: OmpA family protein [Microscillaceae bacterium]|nr:OmpA family protein [Microscillaceae bacterium]
MISKQFLKWSCLSVLVCSSSFLLAQSPLPQQTPRTYTSPPRLTALESATPSEKEEKNLPEDLRGNFLKAMGADLYIQSLAEIPFATGADLLHPKTQKQLKILVDMLRRDINRHRLQKPEETALVLVELKGYSDAQPFYWQQPTWERKKQNHLLSLRRAEAVRQYLEQHLRGLPAEIEYVVQAGGEAYPSPELQYREQDARRRICQVYALLYSEYKLESFHSN